MNYDLDIKVEIQKDWFSVVQATQNPNKLYVFGDNMQRIGRGGQAMIRGVPNAMGIATKCSPAMTTNAFFSDKPEQGKVILQDINAIVQVLQDKSLGFDTLVLPGNGLGTGLSQMPTRSPQLFDWMNATISIIFGVDYDPNW